MLIVKVTKYIEFRENGFVALHEHAETIFHVTPNGGLTAVYVLVLNKCFDLSL